MKKRFPTALMVLIGIAALGILRAAPAQIQTPAEACRFSQYSQHEDVVRFLSALDAMSPQTAVRVVGRTREAEDFPAKDLYLVLITEGGAVRPDQLDRSKPTVLLMASQHGNEQSTKEAALALVRDLAVGDLKPLLKSLNVLVMPQCNPFGNAMDVRVNEQNLDLNRDHVKLEAESTAAIRRVFVEFRPEATIDVHEKGDDYYRVSLGCVSNLNIHASLQDFSRRKILADVAAALERKKIAFFEYLVTQEMGLDSSAGVRYAAEELAGREEMKRYSTTDLNDGRNSLGIYETLSFIQEGASRHDVATLADRTAWQYEGLRAFVESAARHSGEILPLVRGLRAKLLENAGRYEAGDVVHLDMDYARDPSQPTLTLKAFERTRPAAAAGPRPLGTLKTDKKAGETLTAADIVPAAPAGAARVVEQVVKNWFPLVESRLAVARPLGYVIPAAYTEVVRTLLRHGISVGLIAKDAQVEVEAYRIGEIVPAKYDYLPPDKITVEKRTMPALVKQGDFYVSCAQPAAHLIPALLEPQSKYGLIRYRACKLVPEAGNFYGLLRVTADPKLSTIPYKPWN
ncbi:MAG: DUF2817 domain-containing protein [Candidatus Aminicenantes bacterium]|nr:DUF2817 domain-containing protein [Candidatus Aminicenantes bacterium]